MIPNEIVTESVEISRSELPKLIIKRNPFETLTEWLTRCGTQYRAPETGSSSKA